MSEQASDFDLRDLINQLHVASDTKPLTYPKHIRALNLALDTFDNAPGDTHELKQEAAVGMIAEARRKMKQGDEEQIALYIGSLLEGMTPDDPVTATTFLLSQLDREDEAAFIENDEKGLIRGRITNLFDPLPAVQLSADAAA